MRYVFGVLADGSRAACVGEDELEFADARFWCSLTTVAELEMQNSRVVQDEDTHPWQSVLRTNESNRVG